MEAQLKRQMQEDSLQPLKSLEDDLDAERGQETRLGPSDAQESPEVPIAFTQGQIQEAIQFLRFNVSSCESSHDDRHFIVMFPWCLARSLC